jgi:hypothetical protein
MIPRIAPRIHNPSPWTVGLAVAVSLPRFLPPRYRFTNTGNSTMRIVGALGVVLAGLSVVGAVTAYGQVDAGSQSLVKPLPCTE